MKHSFLLMILILPLTLRAQSLTGKEKHTQFDFWVGNWAVNLRVRQSDNSWKDQHQAIAHIHSLMEGKVILELWEEQGRPGGIMGYSLRYYDEDMGKWVLWLNWPGKNRSGSSSLTGNFRHGRGEFFAERSINDSTVSISRYTFSDITPRSLRWDDAYSLDGGKTWTHNWIMEFTRRADQPPPLSPGINNHTNGVQDRCTLDSFDWIKEIASLKDRSSTSTTARFYGILEGCGVLSIIEDGSYEELAVLTYNTYAQVYEQLVFDKSIGKAAIYYGNFSDGVLTLKTQSPGFRSIRKLTLNSDNLTIESYDPEVQRDSIIIQVRR